MKPLLLGLMLLISTALSAEEVSISHQGLTLHANLEKAGEWPTGTVVLMTHGTLAHSKMEIMATLQDLFSDEDISSLSINLSLGIENRREFYDCSIPHTHKHTDALDEIGVWLDWLKQNGATRVVLLGHSRGGNQTAWFAVDRDEDIVKQVVLIAPATWNSENVKSSYKARSGKDLQPLLDKAHSLVEAGNGGTLLENINFIYCDDSSATADAFVSYYEGHPNRDTPYLMPQISKPLLVIAGSEDNVIKDLDVIVQPLAEKHGFELTVIDGADHFFRDLYADEIVESVVEFIDE